MRMMRFPSRTGQVAPGANEHSAVGAKPLGGATQDWPDAAYRKAEGSVPSGAPPTRLPRFDILQDGAVPGRRQPSFVRRELVTHSQASLSPASSTAARVQRTAMKPLLPRATR